MAGKSIWDTLGNADGLRVKIMTYGATISRTRRPTATAASRTSRSRSIARDYPKGHPCLADHRPLRQSHRPGQFGLGGRQYTLAANNGPNHLHGGRKGFDKVVWPRSRSETAAPPSPT